MDMKCHIARLYWVYVSPKTSNRVFLIPYLPPFHGDNMGSNPIGDTNQHKNLARRNVSFVLIRVRSSAGFRLHHAFGW